MSVLQQSKLLVWVLIKVLTRPLILRSKKIVDGMVSSIIMTRIRTVIISEVLNGVNGDIIKKLHISLLHVIIAEKNWKMEKIIRSHSLIQIIQEKVQQKLWD